MDNDIYSVYFLDNDQSAIDNAIKAVSWNEHGFNIIGSNTDSGKAIQEIIDLKPSLVIYEWRIGGVVLMKKLIEAGAECNFVVLTDCKSVATVREFFTNGGFDYLLKPIDTQETETVLNRFRMQNLSGESKATKAAKKENIISYARRFSNGR